MHNVKPFERRARGCECNNLYKCLRLLTRHLSPLGYVSNLFPPISEIYIVVVEQPAQSDSSIKVMPRLMTHFAASRGAAKVMHFPGRLKNFCFVDCENEICSTALQEWIFIPSTETLKKWKNCINKRQENSFRDDFAYLSFMWTMTVIRWMLSWKCRYAATRIFSLA